MDTKEDKVITLSNLLCALFLENDFRVLEGIFEEFGFNIRQYETIRYEMKAEDVKRLTCETNKRPFDGVPLYLFSYEVAMDVVQQKDYIDRLTSISKKILPENTNKLDEKELIIYLLQNIDTDMSGANSTIGGMNSLSSIIAERLDIPSITDNKIYNRYELRQIKKLYKKFGVEESAEPIVLYRSIAQVLEELIRNHDDSYDVVSYRFNYVFLEDEIDAFHKELDIIEQLVKDEIKRFLLYKLDIFEDKEEPLEISQIIRLAPIEEEDIEKVSWCIIKSCEEYFCLREIANMQRKQFLESTFGLGKKIIKEEKVAVSDKKETEDTELLKKQIQKLKSENEVLKGKLLEVQKDAERVLKEREQELEKEITLKDKEAYNNKLALTMWAAFCQLLSDLLLDDEEDIKPYNISEMQQKKIIFVGGREEVKQELRVLFPKAKFVESETFALPSLDVDMVFFFWKFMNHSMLYKYIHKVRNKKIPYGYTGSTNKEKVLSDLYQWMTGERRSIEVDI